MPILSREAIKAAADTKIEKIDVPEWGGEVCIKTLTGTERDAFEDGYSEQKMKNFRARFLALALCDEKGERLYGDDGAVELGQKSSAVINRLFEKAWAVNAFRPEDIDALGNDSPSGQNEGSTSN